MSHGPFDLYPGDEFEITFAIVWSQAGDRLASVAKLFEDVVFVRGFYDQGYQKMDSIDAPVVSAVASDNEVLLSWSNLHHRTISTMRTIGAAVISITRTLTIPRTPSKGMMSFNSIVLMIQWAFELQPMMSRTMSALWLMRHSTLTGDIHNRGNSVWKQSGNSV